MHCAAVSLIKRTARLGDILQFMGHGNSRHDPDWVPPPDAEILAAYFRRMMAKQRWTKAQSALKTIRAMQGGLLGALGGGAAQKAKAFPAFGSIPGAEPKPPPPPPPPEDTRPKTPEDPDSPRSHTPTSFTVVKPRRASVSELTSGASAKAKASAAMGKMPQEKDVRRMLREFRGDWFVVFVDTRFDMILAACSDECTSEVSPRSTATGRCTSARTGLRCRAATTTRRLSSFPEVHIFAAGARHPRVAWCSDGSPPGSA